VEVNPFDPSLYLKNGNASGTALVLVTPHVLRKRDLESSADAVALTGWPVIGVITYQATAQRAQLSSRFSRGGAFMGRPLPPEPGRIRTFHGDVK
jgi:hypothetical protein